MDPIDREHLLRELAQLAERPDGPPPADELLAAYRSGALTDAEAERVEAVLARHPAARERLAALAGLGPRQPGRQVRERVLAAAAAQAGGGRSARRRPSAWTRWGLAAAAAVAVALALPFWRSGPAGPLPEYRLEIAAPSELRGEVGGGERKFHPDQPVPLTVVPVDQAVAGVEFGLYRVVAGRLERLAPSADLRFSVDRGTATLRAPAARLAGPAPGTYELFVVTTRGELPAGRPLAPGEDARRALSAGPGRRQILVDHIEILGSP